MYLIYFKLKLSLGEEKYDLPILSHLAIAHTCMRNSVFDSYRCLLNVVQN